MNGVLDIHPKVVGSTLGGSAALLVVWILTLVHLSATPEQAAALVVVVSAIGGWLAPLLKAHPGEPVPPKQ